LRPAKDLNPAERPRYERWRRFAQSLQLPVSFEVGARPGASFPELLRSAHSLVTTSIAEGFGMAFLEPWLEGRSIAGRDLPEITHEFEDAGIKLGHLYERLEVPLDWIGAATLRENAQAGLQRSLDAYGRQPGAADVERTLDAWLRDDRVDFGRLEQVFIMLQRAPTMDLLYAGKGDEIGGEDGSEEAAPSP